MLKYFWIIEEILIKKPNTYTIVMHDNAINVVQMISIYLQNKCEYVVNINYVNKCFETDTIITLNMNWFGSKYLI